MNDSRRFPTYMIAILLLLIIIILVIHGIAVGKLYVDHHPESRLVKVAERVAKLEDAVENKVKKLERRINPQPVSDGESPDAGGGNPDHSKNNLLPIEGWNPFEEMRHMREQIDKMFGHSLERFREDGGVDDSWLKEAYMPGSDFESKEDRYLVRMKVPDIDKANLEISLEGTLLRIKGHRDELIEHKENGEVVRTERMHGQFLGTFSMPGGIDPDKSTAEYKDGVLVITIPKGEKTDAARKIEVK